MSVIYDDFYALHRMALECWVRGTAVENFADSETNRFVDLYCKRRGDGIINLESEIKEVRRILCNQLTSSLTLLDSIESQLHVPSTFLSNPPLQLPISARHVILAAYYDLPPAFGIQFLRSPPSGPTRPTLPYGSPPVLRERIRRIANVRRMLTYIDCNAGPSSPEANAIPLPLECKRLITYWTSLIGPSAPYYLSLAFLLRNRVEPPKRKSTTDERILRIGCALFQSLSDARLAFNAASPPQIDLCSASQPIRVWEIDPEVQMSAQIAFSILTQPRALDAFSSRLATASPSYHPGSRPRVGRGSPPDPRDLMWRPGYGTWRLKTLIGTALWPRDKSSVGRALQSVCELGSLRQEGAQAELIACFESLRVWAKEVLISTTDIPQPQPRDDGILLRGWRFWKAREVQVNSTPDEKTAVLHTVDSLCGGMLSALAVLMEPG